ncbi:MAG: MerR family transcriptional regulator [Ruminococcaceae bacterium]|nr:MerR family transcriptional regulator [Oscillospiraceae bacterium]
MRMKDMIQRTGLTDRAIRLYIEEGLLDPSAESDYTGRRSFDFSEEDAEKLEIIATLRRAGFSIAEIRDMQSTPDRCTVLLEAHRQTLAGEIRQKQEILDTLSAIPTNRPLTCTEIADRIRTPASQQNIPKEDSAMSETDFKTMLRRRTPAMLSLIFFILSAVQMTTLAVRCAFVTITLQSGGGYQYNYAFSADAAAKHILTLVVPLLLIAAAVCMTVHLLGGRRTLPAAALILGGAAIAVLLLLPEHSKEAMFLFEFHGYRFSFMHKVFFETAAWFDVFLKTLKFLPILISCICAAVGIRAVRDENI